MTRMATSGVRLARTSDVDDIARINLASWRHRFDGLLPAEALDLMVPADLAMTWASGILNPPTRAHRLLVAVDADVIVGFAALGPSQDPDADTSTGELLALEIDPERTGQGHGARLLAATADHATAAGSTVLIAWCPLDDEERRAYLQGAGFGPDSAYRDVLVGVAPDGSEMLVREVRLVTALA